jgi:hypothetical protein
MVGIPVSVLGLGLAGFMAVRMANKAPADDFAKELEKADAAGLQLAQAQAARQYALSETAPESKPEPQSIIKRAPTGAQAVRSKAPTVKAAPRTVAADVVEETPDLTVVSHASGPAQTEASVPSTPEPSPAATPAPGQDQGPILRGGNGSGGGNGGIGMGGVMGGIFGAVIRGGGVDGDNCELHRRPRLPTAERPVYGGNPSGMGGMRGGWGGSTILTQPATPVGNGPRTATRPRG